jgi:DNA-binding transcriptional MerR regulator
MTLSEEIDQIQAYLDITCSNNPEEILERIRVIMTYISRTGFMLAEAKKLLRKRKSDEIHNKIIEIAKEQYLSAKGQNALIDSIAQDEAYLVDRLDRLNAACTHQIDALRSLLSYEREGLRLTKTGY